MVKKISAVVWTTKFINDLPDSSFAWIDSSRSLRHLPFRDSSGKADLPHLRNALARLSQVKDMPPNVERIVRAKLENILERSRKKNDEVIPNKKVSELKASYTAGFESKIVEAGGKKKVVLNGTLLDDSINKNGWRIPKGHELLAQEFNGIPIKMQHMKSDWEIVGTGVNGESADKKVFYEADVTDPDAVQKFETNTWNPKNMGISPTISFEHVICSICDSQLESVRNHEHSPNKKYNGEMCFYDIMNPHLIEASLTSTPAYKPSAGTIDTSLLCASFNKMLNFTDKKTEEKSMSDNATESFEAIVLEKDTKIETLQASLTEKDDKIKEFDASVKEKDEKIKELEANNKENTKKLNEYVVASRKKELEEVLQDKELIAEILKKEMSEDEFKAELNKIKKIQSSIKAPEIKGTVSPDGKVNNADEATKRFGAEMFGSKWKELAGIKEDGE